MIKLELTKRDVSTIRIVLECEWISAKTGSRYEANLRRIANKIRKQFKAQKEKK